jgi:hypothetical protein
MIEPATISIRESGNGTAKIKKPRKRRENVSRFPVSVNFGITASMGLSIGRMCPANGPFNQSTYLRLLVHRGLLQDDPEYREQMGGGKHA